jgi:formyl-CoA transferase
MPGALDGIHVVDFSQHFAGPGTAMYLADQGADVIRVDPPGGGHDRRAEEFSNTFLLLNRGKRSIVLDIRTAAGHEVAHTLVRRADVVLVAWPPGQAERLGYGYETLRELNPRMIYASITGWGQRGPMAMQLGYDRLHQAFTGIMAANTDEAGRPMTLPFFLADEAIPPMLAYGITLGLLARERTGKGQKVETSQLDAQIAMQSLHFVAAADSDLYALPRGAQTYRTSDGRYLTLSPLTPEHFAGLWRALDITDMAPETSSERARSALKAGFEQRPLHEWEERLAAESVPFAPVLTREECMSRSQAWDNEMLARQEHPRKGQLVTMGLPVRLSETRGEVGRPAPGLGEHTREVLLEHGFSDERIEQLYAEGTVA